MSQEEEDYDVFPIDKWKLNDPTRNDRYWRLEVVKHVKTTECDLCYEPYKYHVEIVNWDGGNHKHRVCHACLRRLINTQVNEFNEWSGE